MILPRNARNSPKILQRPIVPRKRRNVPIQVIWNRVIIFIFFHLASFYGIYLMVTSTKWQTNVFAFILYILSGLGITAGVHRLWAHRSYKAKLPLRVFLMLLNTTAFHYNICNWSKDHRVHHKFSETNADPHNAKRGFFFSHIGWLLCEKHPEFYEKAKFINLDDVLEDSVVQFQIRFYLPLGLLCCFILPTAIPMYFWKESFRNAFLVPTIFRYIFTLHQAWLVNSAAHMWGSRPYDVTINPAENILVSLGAVGEGFHNYHHTFPYDYAASEYGIKYNLTTAFINFMALIGQAYDLKTAPKEVILARKLRTGQNRSPNYKQH